ncbi:HAMP domain-containing sensor histidine kinase [Kineococcus rhizosphaerae]|uniref:histidine kinase n=1 Tax=Kineococcus rhizosphaerae TaxID=559628 RepID=A0A2T0QYM8_9ACTN|nr:HAMP domain-containing sensor histidine kinase [Kineococcus rhizosphaerae]PRY11456.1 signal transduction histidine kinase [Kineococcus rhizosphaerae]
MRTVSLRRRVVAVATAVLAALLLAVGLFVDADLGSRLRDDARTRLSSLAELGVQLDGTVDDQTLVNRLQTAGADARLESDEGTVVGTPGPLDGPAGPPGTAGPAPGGPKAAVTQDGDLLRTSRTLRGDRVLVLTTSLRPVEDALAQFRRSMLLGALAGLALAVVASWLLLGRALAPLDTMTATARSIADGDRGRRLDPDRTDTELGRTAAAFDRMIDSLEGAEERATRSRDRMQRFLSDVAHDLRTPLAAVTAAAERLLLDTGEGPDRRAREEAAVRIVREARRAAQLVTDLLSVSRLEELQPRPVRTGLAPLVRAAVEEAGPLGRGVDVRAPEGTVVEVVADPDHVRRVLVNLLSNARRAAPAGPVVVTVDRPDGWGRVVVADGGPGIAPADRERVFDRLVRLDPARAGDGGAGLGLSISRGLARSGGGDLRCADPAEVDLPPGLPRGAVLVLTVPLG